MAARALMQDRAERQSAETAKTLAALEKAATAALEATGAMADLQTVQPTLTAWSASSKMDHSKTFLKTTQSVALV
jgi:hypothetical protein